MSQERMFHFHLPTARVWRLMFKTEEGECARAFYCSVYVYIPFVLQ